MHSITWLDPRTDDADEPEWAVWETECGTYRIAWDADTDTFEPTVTVHEQRDRSHKFSRQVPVAPNQPTLEAAQDAVNAYHCQKHNLTLA